MNPQPPVRRLVLIVDDDALLREYLAEVLQHAGHDTLGAGTAAEALRTIEERGHGIALVLLDIEMPGMSGLALARLLREETTIPFMFLSASDDAETARAAADAGAVGYLVKPVDGAQLLPAFEAALARGDDIRRLRRSEESLTSALAAGRETSIAVGVLMARFHIDRHQAFDVLRDEARSQRRKMGEVAEQILAAEETLGSLHGAIGERLRGHGRT
ncbi:ANTAR domain-containing response regulator [Massilia sp. CFBP9026]|uniref:ANTAR domain-containing response regulator n=1 Tax=Massilia sp. CFBP9026 TaxID=3096536 RepID=UPI002A6B0B2C|nr:response regulator [Massilia sp. CFBP9026]MDY0963035.1 response regulator [Massilia sp. CFBP9026]